MKTFFTFLFSILHFYCAAQWVELNVGNVNASYFSDVHAITTDIALVVGSNGTILKTIDGGVTWQQKESGTNQSLQKVRFSDADLGYIIGTQGTLLKTSDGGENWVSLTTGYNANFVGLSSLGENLIYIAYEDNLLKSANGGMTWQKYPLDFYNGDVQMLSETVGYASKSNGGLLKTVDGGQNWQGLNGYYRFHFINDKMGFCYMDGLRKTTDGGNVFVQLGSGNKSFSKIFAINENTVWGIITPILNGDGTSPGTVKMTYSPENGYKESIEYDDNNTNMLSLYFSNDKLGYAVGNKNGKATVWKNSTGNTLSSGEYDKMDGVTIFPNPASDRINITVKNLSLKETTISLSDMSGKLVHNQIYNNGKDISINVQNFAKGVYLLTVINQNQKYSQKIIID